MSYLKWLSLIISIVFFILILPFAILFNSLLASMMTVLAIIFMTLSFYINFKEKNTKNALKETIIFSFIPWIYLIKNRPQTIQILIGVLIPLVFTYLVALPIYGYLWRMYEKSLLEAITIKNSNLLAYIVTIVITVPLVSVLILFFAIAMIYNKIKKFPESPR